MLSSYTWEELNLSLQDLTPLNQPLIPPVLAQAFAIPLADSQKTEDAAGSSYATLPRPAPSFGMQNNSYTPAPQAANMLPPAKPSQNMPNPQHQNNYPYSQALPQYGMPMQNIQAAMSAGNHPSVGPSPSVYTGFPYGAVGPQTMLPYNMQDPSMYGFPPFGGFPGPAGMFPPYGDYRQPVMVNKESEGKTTGEGDYSEENQARALKRPRLVWTPQLHKCFVEAVNQIGVDKAVPKMIMQIMNVEGLTRENVASHLQKYRLQLKRQEEEKPPDGKEGQGQSCKGAQKKKRRKFSSGYEESRGGGSPVPHNTEGLGSTDKSPEVQQHYYNAAGPSCSDQSDEVDEGSPENGRPASLPANHANTDDDVCSQHGGGNEPEN